MIDLKTKTRLNYVFQDCLKMNKSKEAKEKVKEDYKELLMLVEKKLQKSNFKGKYK